MAKCKFCGQGVRVAPVFHPACWVQAAGKAAEVFCDEYCRYPRELDQEKLLERCMECPLVRLTALGGEV
ncbi:MAG: hypothetical protein UD574_06440 [Agathobaculum butyriciproducens]|jgi:hypothetical protein|nr:hypothetical protein [Agathobaculum butyriciproducens]